MRVFKTSPNAYGDLLRTEDIRITGAHSAASTHICVIPEGQSARQIHRGPLVPGPWGFAVQHALVIDNSGGSRSQADQMAQEVAIGESFKVEGLPGTYALTEDGYGRLELSEVDSMPMGMRP